MEGNILLCNQVLVNIKRAKIEAMRGYNQVMTVRGDDNGQYYTSQFAAEIDELYNLEEEVTASKNLLVTSVLEKVRDLAEKGTEAKNA